jgi:sec-independent protein translocase protein TatC
MSEAADPVETYRMSILDHLRELRTRLVIAMWACLVCVVVAFFFSEQLYDWISAPMVAALVERGEGTMAITDPLEGVFTYLQVSVIAGLFAASPVVFSQIWLFVAPGLYASERKVVLPLVISSTFLLISGGAFCYYVMFGYGFKFLLDVVGTDTAAVLSMSAYLSMAIKFLLAFGLSFQLPVVVWFFARMGLVDGRDMINYARHAVVAIFVISAVLTPTTDPVTQLIMAVPLMGLYLIGAGVAALTSTKKRG